MGQKYLIDTNVISHLFANKLPDNGKEFVTGVINSNFIISVAVEIEVLTYHDIPGKMPIIEEFINLAVILPLDKEVTKKAIELRRSYRKLKLGDAIIAATAVVHQLTLISNNVKDFINIKGLKVINPHTL
ncbi:MAG: type II toxin-antitoxin system VapC family toxin [Bacteroidota bacterium]|nr:type II toxin-antitoxin system VapC family toxin [Bacteroidota bacterium]